MTIAIEATETDLATVLQQVEHGDEVRLMRNGYAVARIVPEQAELPVITPEQRARARQAVRDIDTLRKEFRHGAFEWDDFKSYRDEGRR